MKKNLGLIIGAIISLAIFFFLLSKTDIHSILGIASRINYEYLGVAFLVYLGLMSLRAVRFMSLLETKYNFFEMFKVVSAYSMFSNLLPMKTGELSYIYLSKQSIKLKTGERVVSWFISRLFDFIVLGSIFIALLLSQEHPDPRLEAGKYVVVAFVAALIVILVFTINFGTKVSKIAKKILKKTGLLKIKLVEKLHSKLSSSADYIGKVPFIKLFNALGISIVIWIVQILFMISAFLAIGFAITPLQAITVILFLALVFSLPIQGIGNIGTYEAGAAFALITIGVFEKEAIILAIGIHAIQLAFMLLTGITSLLLMSTKKIK